MTTGEEEHGVGSIQVSANYEELMSPGVGIRNLPAGKKARTCNGSYEKIVWLAGGRPRIWKKALKVVRINGILSTHRENLLILLKL